MGPMLTPNSAFGACFRGMLLVVDIAFRLSSCCRTMEHLPNSTTGVFGRKPETTWLGVMGYVSLLTELLRDSQTAWSSRSCSSGGRWNARPATTARPCSWTVRVARSMRVACSPG